jgi:hypothetical protein
MAKDQNALLVSLVDVNANMSVTLSKLRLRPWSGSMRNSRSAWVSMRICTHLSKHENLMRQMKFCEGYVLGKTSRQLPETCREWMRPSREIPLRHPDSRWILYYETTVPILRTALTRPVAPVRPLSLLLTQAFLKRNSLDSRPRKYKTKLTLTTQSCV